MKSLAVLILTVVTSIFSTEMIGQIKEPQLLYSLTNLTEDFAKMELANINMKIPHTWEFLVTGDSESALLQAREKFSSNGFTAIKMYKESKQNHYILVLEVKKTYTPHSLFEDTQTVEALVKQLGLRSFEKLNIIK